MRRDAWKDDLTALVLATAAQLGVLRLVDWAKAAAPTNLNARNFVADNFYYAPEIIFLLIGYLLVRFVRSALSFRGISFGEWIKGSAVLIAIGIVVMIAAHMDQLLAVIGGLTGANGLRDAGRRLGGSPFYGFLTDFGALRWGIDLVGILAALLGLRGTKPVAADLVAARQAEKAKDFARAGDLFLKVGDLARAKTAFRKAKSPARLAALELRDGKAAAAARLFESAGPAFAWEAAKAWEAAGDRARCANATTAAVAEARATLRWDRLAEIAEATGDQVTVAEASQRLAEGKVSGAGRTGLYRRSGDAWRAAGRLREAGEAYRGAGEFLLSGEMFLASGSPAEAAKDFDRGGELFKAAQAASAAGDERRAQEFLARAAEARGDVMGAGEAWLAAGFPDRAGPFFEKKGVFGRAAAAFRDANRPDRAAPLFHKAGDLQAAATAYEASRQGLLAAPLWRELGENQRAAELFRAGGRYAEAAEALQAAGRMEEASSLFQRAGRGLEAARCQLLAGHREKTWELLMTAQRGEAPVREVFFELAEAHLAANEARDAVHVLREALGHGAVERETLGGWMMLVRALRAAGEASEAASVLDRIRLVDPSAGGGLAGVGVGLPPVSAPPVALETRQVAAAEPSTPYGSPIPPAASPGGSRSSGSFPAVAALPPIPGGVGGSGTWPSIDQPELRYEIVAELGRGGMGVVHKALDRKLDRLVALKILPWQLRGDETAMRYFAREAKAIAALKHPNIVALYDYGEGFGSLYLAMEFLEGPNLQWMLRNDPERLKRNWRPWFIEAARGVAAAHAKGLLHRDIKPANLMLDEHGTLRILDFGLARAEADSGATSKLIGTPAFFPPEVLRGEAPTPASDVYSLGATFYTLATGRWPYVGDDVLVARLERDPDDPRPYAPQLTEHEVETLLKALARHRPERYPDAGELLGALLALEAP